jgi:hypothetical protein
MFNDSERTILRETTFRDIIVRNLEIDDDISQFVSNIWMIQPQTDLKNEEDGDYKTSISPWTDYSIRYRLDNTHIHFKIELQTAGGQGWFGMVSRITVSYILYYIYACDMYKLYISIKLNRYYVYTFFN